MRTFTCRSTFLYGQNTHKLQYNLTAITEQIVFFYILYVLYSNALTVKVG